MSSRISDEQSPIFRRRRRLIRPPPAFDLLSSSEEEEVDLRPGRAPFPSFSSSEEE
jgi:hypothetical protein